MPVAARRNGRGDDTRSVKWATKDPVAPDSLQARRPQTGSNRRAVELPAFCQCGRRLHGAASPSLKCVDAPAFRQARPARSPSSARFRARHRRDRCHIDDQLLRSAYRHAREQEEVLAAFRDVAHAQCKWLPRAGVENAQCIRMEQLSASRAATVSVRRMNSLQSLLRRVTCARGCERLVTEWSSPSLQRGRADSIGSGRTRSCPCRASTATRTPRHWKRCRRCARRDRRRGERSLLAGC